MPVRVQPLTQEDVPRMVDIHQIAMEASAFFRSVGDVPNTAGTTDTVDKIESPCRTNMITRILNDWNKDPAVHYLKAVDIDSGEMIAFARWHVYHGDKGLDEWRESVRTDAGMRIPYGTNEEGYRFCQSHLFERRKLLLEENGREHCLLALLATDPQFERRGAASALTQWGCDMADQLGIECYVESSKKGYPVYQRKGFQDASSENDRTVIRFDASRFTGRGGGEGDWVNLTCMIRKPCIA